ncbi:hypothetical protein A2U01_0076050, partial [Trifolium medium]|nr:hypothetical protein [Trifolium medium]
SNIIDKFCAEGPFSTPHKSIPPVDLDDDDLSDGSDYAEDTQTSVFVADLIVNPEASVRDIDNMNV